MDISGKTVVITGGASGIGAALARQAGAKGARVCIADLNLEAAQQIAKEIGGIAVTCDVSHEQQIIDAIGAAETAFGPVDVFVSNAGIVRGDPDHAASAPDVDWTLNWNVHVMAHVWAARACLPGMIARGEGYFLNTASAAGLLNQVGDAAYSTTKHAAVGFAESLAITHGDDGIKVSCLCPQAVSTRMIGSIEGGGTAGVDGIVTPEQVAETVVQGLAEEKFLLLPHPEVVQYRERKTADYDRWLGGMRKLRRSFGNPII